MTKERILGEGWELGVFREGDDLILSVPVETGFYAGSVDFKIDDRDFVVLRQNAVLRKTLELCLHDMTQGRFRTAYDGASDAQCLQMIQQVLHGTDDDVAEAIESMRNPIWIKRKLSEA